MLYFVTYLVNCLPDSTAIVSVEVIGQFLPAVHASFFYSLWKHKDLYVKVFRTSDQFYVATSTCPISLWDKHRDTISPQ